MEDYLQREIDKIGQFLLAILSKYTKRGQETQSLDAFFLKKELQDKLHLDLDRLLDVDDPVAFLINEYGFTNENMTTLVQILQSAYPADERVRTFIKKVVDNLDASGCYYMEFHSDGIETEK